MKGGQPGWLARFGQSRTAPGIALATLLVSLGVAALMPVYTDEIVWRFHERAWLDGGYDVWMNDLCGPNTIARAPWFMMPARWFSATVNLALPAPLYVRLEGIACALLWLAMLWRITGRAIGDPARRNAARTLGLALLGLGVTPYLLALSRPEQPLILAVGAMILIALGPAHDNPRRAWRNCAAVLALATIGLSYHLKGVLYAPVAAVCLWACARGRGAAVPRVLAGLALAAAALVALRYWSGRFACPHDPVLAARFAGMNLATVLGAGAKALGWLPGMLLNATPANYIALAAPSPDPISNWLPPGRFSAATATGFRVAMIALWAGLVLAAALAAWRSWRQRRFAALRDPRAVIGAAIVACLLVWGFGQISKHMYEAAHVVPLLAVAAVLLLGLPGRDPAAAAALLARVAVLTLAVTLASQALVAVRLAPAFLSATGATGLLAAQPHSVALSGYREVKADIRRAMATAGIAPESATRRLVVDEVTYLALQRSRLPLLSAGVFGQWRGSIGDPPAYLRRQGSSGVVVDCRSLPSRIARFAHRAGTICALAPADLAKIPPDPSRSRPR